MSLPHLGMFWAQATTAISDEHGRFQLSGIPDTRSFVHAVDTRDSASWNSIVLEAGEHRELAWDVTLERRDSIWIELRDHRDRPLGGRIVLLASQDPELSWVADSRTDASGRARFRPIPDVPLELAVYPLDYVGDARMELIVPDITPSLELQVLHVSDAPNPELASLRASIPAGLGVARLYAYHFEAKSRREIPFDERTGKLAAVSFQPGEYELFVNFNERGLLPLGPLELEPGGIFDLGLIEPPPGETVRFTPFPVDWGGQRHAELVVIHEPGDVTLARTVRRIDLRAACELELLPADYRLRLDAIDSIREIAFTVWPDEPLEVDVARRLAEDRELVEGEEQIDPQTRSGERR